MAPTTSLTRTQRLLGIFSGSAGNLIEYYDWYVYSAFALYFAHNFFPSGNQTAQLLQSAAVFAVGFLMRPVGGWLMGIMADRHGRKLALSTSIIAMCAGSLIIAVCPGYSTIGIAAPVILVVARLVQGLSLGGEYGASATYLSEIAPAGHRGFYSSFQYVTLVAGQLVALLVLLVLQHLLLTQAQISSFGWRIPFGIGALLALATLCLRRGMKESEQFEATRNSREKGGIRALWSHPREVLTVCGLTLGGTVAFYTYTIYMQKYLVNSLGFSRNDSTLISAGTLIVYAVLQPVIGAVSDKIGPKALLITFGTIATVGNVPFMRLVAHTQSHLAIFVLISTALLVVSCYTAINAVVKAELFPARIRALGVALPYALTVSIFGGTAEYVALWFRSIGHEDWFYWYVSGCTLITLITALTLSETRQIDVV